MSKIKFELNREGVRELLKSAGAESICREYAERARSRAGEHYAVEARHYPERSGAAVYPNDGEGYHDNLKNNTLLKVLR